MNRLASLIFLSVCFLFAASISYAEEDDPRPAAGIQDNSFLIEEAYNQEPGVVQHISTLRKRGRDWHFSFTQEWPMGTQEHQFSYSVPYSWIRNEDGRRVNGVGDILLNYRPQIWTETATRPALAPRFSLILPTGSESKGLGDGTFGIQTNVAVSKIVSDRVTVHGNAGFTALFDVQGHSPTSYNLGGSVIYAVTRNFNLMLENVAEWEQSVNSDRILERQFTYTVSPGFRYGMDFPQLADLQVVLGAAAPIGFTQGKPTEYGLFFYLSFEHRFLPKKAGR